MPKKHEFTEFERGEIIGLWKGGHSERNISEILDFPKSTIHDTITDYKNSEKISAAPRSGRPPKLAERDVRRIVRIVKKDRQQSLDEITKKFNDGLPSPVCNSIVKHILHSEGYFGRTGKRKPLVSEANRKKRLDWCCERKEWDTEWDSIIWSDESRFLLFQNDAHHWVWRKPHKKYDVNCLIPTVKSGNQGVMPAQSPDLNLIEHLWDVLERKVRAHKPHPKNIRELMVVLEEKWNNIEPEILINLVDSMPRRVQAVLDSREILADSGRLQQFRTRKGSAISICTVGTLPLRLFIISDELEITLERVLNLLKMILLSNVFYGCEPQVRPIVFLTDDLSAERNTLKLCWSQGICLLYIFYVLQAFWRWLHDLKHCIKKEDRLFIISKIKEILYSSLFSEKNMHYSKFKEKFYCSYLLLQKHFELLWKHRQSWALSFRTLFLLELNSEIGVCTCPVGMNSAPCKHQKAVAMKFHISMFNFIPSLTANDHKIYSYIAFGCVAKNNSFYASLRAGPIPQDQESDSLFINNGTEWKKLEENREPEKETNEINDNSAIDIILEEIRVDYENGGPHLRTALDKFAERYTAAKSKSIPKLCSFLYDLNRDLDQVRSGSMIRVQVESIRRRKTEKSGSKKRELLEEKENLDPQIIPSRKKKKTGKKEHNLSLHIDENRTN
ncbi:transposable element Tc1 transposase [Rhizophagus clarus]|uniref:Transposable element Tc1 transposase n=1 Tax=Rhizophagus clarus TaxID=94130 RepID=A0A8H3MFB9_9GLOM|nr:transposable element Tc1 transposase [Rhizophagus clarus]